MSPNMREFERDRFLKQEVERLIKEHGIQTVIETGTEYGGTANAFAKMVPQVFTMDIEKKFNSGDLRPNVTFLHGDSRDVLKVAIVRSKDPALFFLDAHSSIDTDDCPLRNELEIISLLNPVEPVILVHDCQVPGTDFGFDSYRGKPISWEMIADIIPVIFPMGHTHYFNTRADGARRGVLFIEPRQSGKGMPHLSNRKCSVCGETLVTNGESHCPNPDCERAMRAQ